MPRSSKIANFYIQSLELTGDISFARSMTTGIFKVTKAELTTIMKEYFDGR